MSEGPKRGRFRHRWLIAAVGVGLISLGILGWGILRNRDARSGSVSPSGQAAGGAAAANPPVPVTTATARRGTIERSVPISGVIRAETETQLAARMPARVLGVFLREGDYVLPGQLLVRLDDREARAAVEAACAGVEAAEAALAKAQGGATVRGAEITSGVATAEAAVAGARSRLAQAQGAARAAEAEAAAELRRAEAGLEAARANLATAVRGPRPEQRRQAESAVTQAETAANAARRGLDEAQFLYDRGGLTRAQLEEARVAEQTARARLESARAARDQVLQGATPEERRAAEAAVRQADAGVDVARAGQRRAALSEQDVAAAAAQLRQAEAGLRSARAGQAGQGVARADTRAAAAALQQAQVQRRQAQEQWEATRLVSPAAGVVTLRAVEPGQIAQPGQPLVAVAWGSRVFEAAVSPATVALLRPGQPVALTSDAAPGRHFRALMRDVPAVPGPDGRTYTVRARILDGAAEGEGRRAKGRIGGAGGGGGEQAAREAEGLLLPPGARARGSVQVARTEEVLLVPAAAVQHIGGRTVVWVARGGRAERRTVSVGVETDTAAQILAGVAEGEAVIVSGAEGLQPGDAVDAGERGSGGRGRRGDAAGRVPSERVAGVGPRRGEAPWA